MKKEGVKKLIGAIIALFALVVLLMWLQGTIGGHKVKPGTVEKGGIPLGDHPTFTVVSQEVEDWEESVGTVMSRVCTDVSSKILANILEIKVKSGDQVSKDDLLVVLADQDIHARLNQAMQKRSAAEANFIKAKSDYERYKRLYQTGTVTKNQFEGAEARFKVAQAQLEQSRQAIKEAEVNLGYTQISAPTTGTVVEKHADVGDLASPGTPLVTIHDPSQLRLEASVQENLAPKIAVGDTVKVKIDALNKFFEGPVEEMAPAADPLSRSFLVKVTLPEDKDLKPGMFGRLLFPGGKTTALTMPLKAIRRIGQLETVQVVEDNILKSRHIKTGKSFGDSVEILSGLKEGEVVAR